MKPALGALTAILMVLASGQRASAQSPGRLYTSLSLGSYGVDADEVKDITSAVGGALGFEVLRWLDVELDVVRPIGALTREYTGTSVSFAPFGSTREEIERLAVLTRFGHERRVRVSLSGAAIFKPAARGRFRPGFIVGLTPVPVTERFTAVSLRIPPGVDPAHPSVLPRDDRVARVRGGLTLGGRLVIEMTRHLAVVPDVRLDYGSIGDQIDNVFRTSVRMQWRF